MSDTIKISKLTLAKAFSVLAAGIIAGTTNQPPTKEQLSHILESHLKNDYVLDLVDGFAEDFDNYEDIINNPSPMTDEEIQVLASTVMGGPKAEA